MIAPRPRRPMTRAERFWFPILLWAMVTGSLIACNMIAALFTDWYTGRAAIASILFGTILTVVAVMSDDGMIEDDDVLDLTDEAGA